MKIKKVEYIYKNVTPDMYNDGEFVKNLSKNFAAVGVETDDAFYDRKNQTVHVYCHLMNDMTEAELLALKDVAVES